MWDEDDEDAAFFDQENDEMSLQGHLDILQKNDDKAYHGELDFKEKLKLSMEGKLEGKRKPFFSGRAGPIKKVIERPPALPAVNKDNLRLILKKLTPPFDQITKNQMAVCIKQA